uniref:ATP synthase F0 subunit 8 n=1 Tax=Phatnoma laciniatum TaxID=1964415 RepID=A0A343BT94_9HEMI|nr:ATP synthase F0 subunit 8 [Phatnoma laciniatum]ARB50159.1 ATP synthase F0 subunit 8 [Phatnoma laciniatum]
MPHMSPMWWLTICSFTLTSLIIFMIKMYFEKESNKFSKMNMKKMNQMLMNWKW